MLPLDLIIAVFVSFFI